MSDAFLGEIRLFAGNFPPVGWAFCNGQLLSISQNTALFSILGTRFGGNGMTNFALPNLAGAAPMGQGAGTGLTPRQTGEMAGSESVTLDTTQMPAHNHSPNGIEYKSDTGNPTNNYWSESSKVGAPIPHQTPFYSATPNVQLSPNALAVTGNSVPHNNMQPYLAMNFIICLNGYFPSRS